ncbi:hypothetical protein Dimus_003542 [Dionaea muscipula]
MRSWQPFLVCLAKMEYVNISRKCGKNPNIPNPLKSPEDLLNDDTIMKARRVRSVEMKPSQRFIHFLVMKNVIPRFGKRDTTSFMDLSYMDHLTARRLVNLPRVMMRHMSYVISVKDHELPYGDWLTMEVETIGEEMRKLRLRRKIRKRKKKEIRMTLVGSLSLMRQRLRGNRGSDDQFYDAQVEVEEPMMKHQATQRVQTSSSDQQKDQEPSGVDPSGPTSREADFLKFQAEFERKRANRFHDELEKAKAENAKLLALLHQAQTKPHP